MLSVYDVGLRVYTDQLSLIAIDRRRSRYHQDRSPLVQLALHTRPTQLFLFENARSILTQINIITDHLVTVYSSRSAVCARV